MKETQPGKELWEASREYEESKKPEAFPEHEEAERAGLELVRELLRQKIAYEDRVEGNGGEVERIFVRVQEDSSKRSDTDSIVAYVDVKEERRVIEKLLKQKEKADTTLKQRALLERYRKILPRDPLLRNLRGEREKGH